jgi:hypothetical protein
VNVPKEQQAWIAVDAVEAAQHPAISQKIPAFIEATCSKPLQ